MKAYTKTKELLIEYRKNGNNLFQEPWEKKFKKYRSKNNAKRPKSRKK